MRLLWDVCRIPDFRGTSQTDHIHILARIFEFLVGRGLAGGRVPSDWLRTAIERLDRPGGDIDTISKRLAYIRTWTYVAQRKGWVEDETYWREETRAVEDRLSDALHMALTQRFVDRRTSVLLRRLKQKETLVAEVNDKGEVTVEGEFVGRLQGFRFSQDAAASADEAKTLAQAAMAALKPEFSLRADRFYNAPDTEMDFTNQGGLMWGDAAVGKLVKGAEPMKPAVEPFVDEEAGPEVADKVRRRLQHFIDRKVAALFEPLAAMSRDEALTGLARGFAFRMVENLGIIPRDMVAAEVKELDQEARAALRKHGLRFGQFTIFLPALLKPAPTRLRLVLWSLWNDLAEFPEAPPPGLVTIPNLTEVPRGHYALSGYHPAGARAIRIDMLERLADIIRTKDSRAGFEATPEMLSITGMTLEHFADLMGGLGYRGEKGERVKVKQAAAPATPAAAEGEAGAIAEPAVTGETPNPVPEEVSLVAPAPDAVPGGAPDLAPDATPSAAEVEPASEAAVEPAEAVAEAATSAEPAAEAAPEVAPEAASAPAPEASEPAAEAEPAGEASTETEVTAATGDAPAPEMEVFYTFTWAPRPRSRPSRPDRRRDRGGQQGAADQSGEAGQPVKPRGGEGSKRRSGKPGRKGDAGGKGETGGKGKPQGQKTYDKRPPRAEKPIDPDSPFAVLAALKSKV